MMIASPTINRLAKEADMESFQVPISIVVALAVCLTLLAITISEPAIWIEPKLLNTSPDPALATQCDRLITRYLLSDSSTFDGLVKSVQKYSGARADEMILKSISRMIYNTPQFRRDRAFVLRGKILEKMERYDDSAKNFQAALRWNPDNMAARRGLVAYYQKNGAFDLVRLESEKALSHQMGDADARYFRITLNQANLHSARGN